MKSIVLNTSNICIPTPLYLPPHRFWLLLYWYCTK